MTTFINSINLNQIRIFECVYRTQSMTTASLELHLTQSGVSQHIRSLEDMLGVKLFDRIKQKLVPTSASRILFDRCSKGLTEIEQGLWQIKTGEKELQGTVSIGMPIEFGNNVVLPLLSKFCEKNPLVKFKLKLDFASAMNDSLLKGELDFAFIDDFNMDRRIKTENVYDEVLDLCITDDLLKKKGPPKHTKSYFQGLDYVEYQDNEPILRMWFGHHLNTRNIDLNVRAVVMDVQGVARLISNGLGAGILPGHLLSKLQKEGHKLHRFKGCGEPLKNKIQVAYLTERTHSPAALTTLGFLKERVNPVSKVATTAAKAEK